MAQGPLEEGWLAAPGWGPLLVGEAPQHLPPREAVGTFRRSVLVHTGEESLTWGRGEGRHFLPGLSSPPGQRKNREAGLGEPSLPRPGFIGCHIHGFPLPFSPCLTCLSSHLTQGGGRGLGVAGASCFPLVLRSPPSLLLPGLGPKASSVEMPVLEALQTPPLPSSSLLPYNVPFLDFPNTQLNLGLVGQKGAASHQEGRLPTHPLLLAPCHAGDGRGGLGPGSVVPHWDWCRGWFPAPRRQ